MEAPQESARIGLLEAIQVNLLNARLTNPSDVLCQTYGIGGDPALTVCFVRTVSGRFWEPSYCGGNHTWIADFEMHE